MNNLICSLLKAMDAQQGTYFMDVYENLKIIRAKSNGSLIYSVSQQKDNNCFYHTMDKNDMFILSTNGHWTISGKSQMSNNYSHFDWMNFSTVQSSQDSLDILKGSVYVVPYYFLTTAKYEILGVLKRSKKQEMNIESINTDFGRWKWTCAM